jgi:PAS domain-containing protein
MPSHSFGTTQRMEPTAPSCRSNGDTATQPPLASSTTSSGGGDGKRTLPLYVEPSYGDEEDDRVKRRQDRNMREQHRSQQVADQINVLKTVLTGAKINFKADKYSTLVSVAGYIKHLQDRSALLDVEHQKLLTTIVKSNDMVADRYVSAVADVPADLVAAEAQDDLVVANGIDYKSIFGSFPFACSVTSMDGRFLDCNTEFQRTSGYSRQELLRSPSQQGTNGGAEGMAGRNMSLFNIVHQNDMGRVFGTMSEMLKRSSDDKDEPTKYDGDTQVENIELCRNSGQSVRVLVYSSLV